MACKTCGKSVEQPKERRILQGKVYSALVEVVRCEGQNTSLHSFLSSTGQTYVCKRCHTTLNKYSSIMDELTTIRENVRGAMRRCELTPAGTTTRPPKRPSCGGPPSPKRSRTMEMQQANATSGVPRQLFPIQVDPKASPSVTVVVSKQDQKSRYFHLSRSLKRLGKYVGRGKRRMIVKAVVENVALRQEVIHQLSKVCRKEIRKICSDSHDSILRMKSKVAVEHFSWETVWLELQNNAPLLVTLFKQLFPEQKKEDQSTIMAICVCISILLQAQNGKINLVQAVIGLLLRNGHATKQVFTRLKRLHLCISYSTLLVVLDEAAEGHDEIVGDWKDNLTPPIPLQNNMVLGDQQLELGLPSPSLPNLSDVFTSSVSIINMCDTEDMNSTTKRSSMSPQAPPFSPIAPEASISSEPDTALHCMSTSHDSAEIQQETIATPCLPIATSSPKQLSNEWNGFKIVLDNIDMNVQPRHQTFHRQTKSVHYVNAYAIRDRIDFSGLAETLPIAQLSIDDLLPTDSDHSSMMANFVILAGRILWESIPALHKIPNLTTDHIKHTYYKEMSSKSQIVPLGILMKNENKMEDMVDILTHMHQYVPFHAETKTLEVQGAEGSEQVQIQIERLHRILIGGDQLTAERVKGAQNLRKNSTHAVGRLEGLVPVSEDWHAKVCFLQVIWKRLFGKGNSFTESGTLTQLKALINRTNAPTEPKKNVNAAEDFLEIVLRGYIVAAALSAFKMKSIDDNLPPSILHGLTQVPRQKSYNQIVQNVLRDLVMLPNTPGKALQTGDSDGVLCYTKEAVTFGLLYAEFEDAIKEGDGARVVRCWRFFLLIFRASNRTKYALEAATLLINLHVLPQRLAQQIMWSRFVNMSGKAGHNKPCDLHMEHLNRTAKEALGPQACLNPKSVKRIGNCIALFQNVCRQFDIVSDAHHSTGKHVQSSDTTDLQKIVHQLLCANVFQKTSNRCHKGFESINGKSLTDRINAEKFKEWLVSHIHRFQVRYKYMND